MTEIGNLPVRYRPIRRLTQLYAGLCLYALGMALMVQARLGLDPWDVFHQGLARRTGLPFGWIVIVVGAAVLLAWVPLRQRPGLGTVSNVVVIGVVVQVLLDVLPTPQAMGVRVAFLVVGVALGGPATGLYIGARLGPGPRDGLMTGLVRRYAGRRLGSIRVVRTAIECGVLAVGFALGGNVGVGTLLYGLSIGPLAHLFIPLCSVPSARPAAQDQHAGHHDQATQYVRA